MSSSKKVQGEYISPARLNAGHSEWIERDRLRKLNQLQHVDNSLMSSQNHPWAPLGERPDGFSSLGDRTPDRSQRSAHGDERSRSTTATSRSCRSPASSAGASIVHGSQRLRTSSRPHSQASKPPSTGGSRPITGQMPPMTGSTTLSQMYRRAISTPALRTSRAETVAHKEETGLGGGMAGRSSEPWYCEHPKMGTQDLVKIVEHLHYKVLKEKRKRLKAEQDQQVSDMLANTFHSGTGSAGPGSPGPAASQ